MLDSPENPASSMQDEQKCSQRKCTLDEGVLLNTENIQGNNTRCTAVRRKLSFFEDHLAPCLLHKLFPDLIYMVGFSTFNVRLYPMNPRNNRYDRVAHLMHWDDLSHRRGMHKQEPEPSNLKYLINLRHRYVSCLKYLTEYNVLKPRNPLGKFHIPKSRICTLEISPCLNKNAKLIYHLNYRFMNEILKHILFPNSSGTITKTDDENHEKGLKRKLPEICTSEEEESKEEKMEQEKEKTNNDKKSKLPKNCQIKREKEEEKGEDLYIL